MRLHGEPTCDVGGQRRALEPRAAALLALVGVSVPRHFFGLSPPTRAARCVNSSRAFAVWQVPI